jgi:hypothetical protein
MKDFSLPRLAILLWFLNYTFFALAKFVFGGGIDITFYVIYATVFMAVELVCLGWIEDLG